MSYIKPEMEIVYLLITDIITTSTEKDLDNWDPGLTPDVDAGF